jgi:hypothetical protein
MSDVRVHVRLGSIRLEYEGDQSFYEKHVEALVAAAAAAGPREARPAGGDGAAREAVRPPAREARPGGAPAPAASEGSPRVAPASFVPQSGEFGRFLRRIGREATQPDQQVVGIAFYLWLYEKRERFGLDELEGCFRAVGLTLPEGIDGILVDLSDRKRFLEPAGEGTWRLSRKGENYVKTRLLTGGGA